MNPFEIRPRPLESTLMDWKEIRPVSYDKRAADPYTRTRVILMNGTEFEATWFSHQFSRNCSDNHVRRVLALLRRSEQQQQKLISLIKPADETLLEHTIGYEQLAVDLTAHLAQRERDPYVKKALDFALLEDFDHLYRYADYMNLETGEKAENLVGRYTEIMPGRPTVAHYRHPYDTVRYHINNKRADLQTRLCVGIITAAEQQTMNYYMNVCGAYPCERGRWLYQEIGMVEEDHVTHYGSLMDPNATWFENLLMHQYTEAYLYYSCMETETDPRIRRIWEKLLEQEISHLHAAANLLQEQECKDWRRVIGGDGSFPAPLVLRSNIDYVRHVQGRSVQMTGLRENYQCVNDLPPNADFFRYQGLVNRDLSSVQSHTVIEDHIRRFGTDYRFEVAPNPIPQLIDRTRDNTEVGRIPCASNACCL
ncbi:MAG: hypothetical protein IKB34_02200 [Clostridia bacterium]|nr:hypothetical protein [Clostridia bacterium]MBR7143092.1 hypothetical protein [Clostridia bacterium]